MAELSFLCPTEPLNEFMIPLRSKAAKTRTPLYCNFSLTHRCTFRCQHCYLGDQHSIRRHKDEELTTDEVLSILDQIVEAGTLFITLTGGDPLIREDFSTIYTYAVQSGLLVTVFCNGSLINKEYISLWQNYPPHIVEVSMYGATSSTCENVSQVKGSYELLQQGIDLLHQGKIPYRLKTALLKSNCHELALMKAKADELGVHFRYDPLIFPCMPSLDNGGLSNMKETASSEKNGFSLHNLFPEVSESRKNQKTTASLLAPLSLRLSAKEIVDIDLGTDKRWKDFLRSIQEQPAFEENNLLFPCGAGRLNYHITPYGQLTPCIVSYEPTSDLRRQSFQAGWEKSLVHLQQFTLNRDDTCFSCEYRLNCCTCPAMSVLETGDYHKPSEVLCDVTKLRMNRVLRKSKTR